MHPIIYYGDITLCILFAFFSLNGVAYTVNCTIFPFGSAEVLHLTSTNSGAINTAVTFRGEEGPI